MNISKTSTFYSVARLDNIIIYIDLSSEVNTVQKFVYTDEALLLVRQ